MRPARRPGTTRVNTRFGVSFRAVPRSSDRVCASRWNRNTSKIDSHIEVFERLHRLSGLPTVTSRYLKDIAVMLSTEATAEHAVPCPNPVPGSPPVHSTPTGRTGEIGGPGTRRVHHPGQLDNRPKARGKQSVQRPIASRTTATRRWIVVVSGTSAVRSPTSPSSRISAAVAGTK